METKKIAIIMIAVIIILLIAAVIVSQRENTIDDTNITLIKADTKGYATIYDGKESYHYYLIGVLQNLPSKLDGYDIETRFYSSDGKYFDDDNEGIYGIAEKSAESEKSTLGAITTHENYEIKKVEIHVVNPDGVIVFNETVKFDMNKFDYSGLNETNTDDEDNSAHYSVQGEVNGQSYSYDAELSSN